MKLEDDNLGSQEKPYFYQIMWFENLTKLTIPLEFYNDHLASEKTRMVTVRGPRGSSKAKLHRSGDGVYLVEGWEDFVRSHNLGEMEFAVFLYDGWMSFDVEIYGSHGSLIDYETPPAPPSFPFFEHEMKRHNIGPKSTVLVPKAFASQNLPNYKHAMVLRDSDGISWHANIFVTSNGQFAIGKGWKDFADAHSIRRGDVWIFELVEKNLMQVRSIR